MADLHLLPDGNYTDGDTPTEEVNTFPNVLLDGDEATTEGINADEINAAIEAEIEATMNEILEDLGLGIVDKAHKSALQIQNSFASIATATANITNKKFLSIYAHFCKSRRLQTCDINKDQIDGLLSINNWARNPNRYLATLETIVRRLNCASKIMASTNQMCPIIDSYLQMLTAHKNLLYGVPVEQTYVSSLTGVTFGFKAAKES